MPAVSVVMATRRQQLRQVSVSVALCTMVDDLAHANQLVVLVSVALQRLFAIFGLQARPWIAQCYLLVQLVKV